MCIAIAILKGKMLEKDVAKRCWDNNPDGAGFCYVRENKVRIEKGFMTFDEFWNRYSYWDLKDVPHLIHFRIQTSGKTDRMNTHPWRITKDIAMIHNGMLKYPHSKKLSDTGCFVNEFLRPLARKTGYEYIMDDPGLHQALEPIMGSSKLVFLDSDSQIRILNEKAGVWTNPRTEEVVLSNKEKKSVTTNDRWFSNQSYMYSRSSGRESSYASAPSVTKPVQIGEYDIVPMCVRFSGKSGDYLSNEEIIALGWRRHTDGSWTSPIGWIPDINIDIGEESDSDDDFEYCDDLSVEQEVMDYLASEDDNIKEQASCRRQLQQHHILCPGNGTKYSVRRCDVATELRSMSNLSWQVIEELSDEKLMEAAIEFGVIEE